MTQIDVLNYLVGKGPGRTQIELAQAIHGRQGYQQQVNQDLGLMVTRGIIECRGDGGIHDPYRYHLK